MFAVDLTFTLALSAVVTLATAVAAFVVARVRNGRDEDRKYTIAQDAGYSVLVGIAIGAVLFWAVTFG